MKEIDNRECIYNMDQSTVENQSVSSENTAHSPIYNKGRKFKLLTALCAILLSAVCSVCFALLFDTDYMYFASSPLVWVYYGLIAATFVAATVFILVSKERIAPSRRRASAWFGWLAGLELLHLLIVLIIQRSWLTALLLVAAIIYIVGVCSKNHALNTLLGIMTVIFCVSIIAMTYFSNDIPVNSPFKVLCQLGIALFMLLVLCELRFDLGGGKPRIYMLVSCMTFCVNLCAVAANAVLTFREIGEISIYSVPACAIVIYLAKLFFAHAPQNTDTVDEGSKIADAEAPEQINESTAPTEEDNSEKGNVTDENVG